MKANNTKARGNGGTRFAVKEQVLSDGSVVFDVYLRRADGEIIPAVIESAISEGHAYAIMDDLNAALEKRGVA